MLLNKSEGWKMWSAQPKCSSEVHLCSTTSGSIPRTGYPEPFLVSLLHPQVLVDHHRLFWPTPDPSLINGCSPTGPFTRTGQLKAGSSAPKDHRRSMELEEWWWWQRCTDWDPRFQLFFFLWFHSTITNLPIDTIPPWTVWRAHHDKSFDWWKRTSSRFHVFLSTYPGRDRASEYIQESKSYDQLVWLASSLPLPLLLLPLLLSPPLPCSAFVLIIWDEACGCRFDQF